MISKINTPAPGIDTISEAKISICICYQSQYLRKRKHKKLLLMEPEIITDAYSFSTTTLSVSGNNETDRPLAKESHDHPVNNNNSNPCVPDEDFYAFFKSYFEKRKTRLATGSYQNYQSELSKLISYKGKMKFSELTLDFILDYERYLVKNLGNKVNTAARSLHKIKTVVKQACMEGKLATNPFNAFRCTREHTFREYLTMEELEKFEALLNCDLSKSITTVLKAFLFSSYTGIRFSDVRQINQDNVLNNMLIIKQQKTREIIKVPLCSKARALLTNTDIKKPYFPLANNAYTNKVLQKLTFLSGIRKKITFHVSRHTFATLSLNLGIPIEVVSRLLGHNDIQTTQIYAKVTDKTKVEMMGRWGRRIGLLKQF